MFTAIVDVIYLNSAGLAFVDVTDISCFIYSDILTDWPGVKNEETGQMEFCVMGKNDQAVYSKGMAPSSRNLPYWYDSSFTIKWCGIPWELIYLCGWGYIKIKYIHSVKLSKLYTSKII